MASIAAYDTSPLDSPREQRRASRRLPRKKRFHRAMGGAMKAETREELLATVASSQADLNRLARASDTEIESITRVFKGLASQADTILKQAASIVSCVEKDSTDSLLSKVRTLCEAVQAFLEQRLKAATTILEMLKEEEKLLGQLTRIRCHQEAVASHLKALSVLTNVEVAQLGDLGSDFQLLARELCEFSLSVTQQTHELANQTESCKQTIEETRRGLTASLPQLRSEMVRAEDEIAKTLQTIATGLSQLASVPGQFKTCAEKTGLQIASVVSAILSHDITHQQIQHVHDGLHLIASRARGAPDHAADEWPTVHAGLTIQVYQLKSTKATVAGWTSQIRTCMSDIQRLSASEIAGIGSVVLNQERELSSQLAQIERLQQRSQAYSGRIQNTLRGLSQLLDLLNGHLGRSQSVRHRLQLLTFNSLIEANRLGRRGAAVSAIANLIREVSAEWNIIAEQSGLALSEILKLVKQTNEAMEVFSEVRGHELGEDQAQTRAALEDARGLAALVAKEAAPMQTAIEGMQADVGSVGSVCDHLDLCYSDLDAALRRIEALARGLETDDPRLAERYDAAEIERLFSAGYTTEIERDVMRAALRGTPLPVLQHLPAGNAVELF